MNDKNYILVILCVVYTFIAQSQEAVLCTLQTDTFRIENSLNIPVVSSNGDDTITLTFSDQDVTAIFANHDVIEFYQAYPNSSEALEKYYNISYYSRALIEDIITNVPIDIIKYEGFSIDDSNLPIDSGISSNLIAMLDGNTFDVIKYITTSDGDPCSYTYSCPLIDVPTNFNFRVIFNYNTETELLLMESETLSPCGNTFTIALTGGNPNEFGNLENTLQLWEATPGTSSLSEWSQPCYYIESTLFSILNIACSPNNYSFGNISVVADIETETFRFIRSNAVFGYHIIEFSKANLSVEDETFNLIKPFVIDGNPYLKLSNHNNQQVRVEIFNTSGQQIIQINTFEENSLDISNFQSGLYFIKLSNLINQQKVFKFLKK